MLFCWFLELLVFLLLFTCWLCFFVNINSQFFEYTVDRVNFVDGSFSGNNRINGEFQNKFDEWVSGDLVGVFFGLRDYTNSGESTWKSIFVKTGVVGFVEMASCYLALLGFFSRVWSDRLLLFILVFAASIYQRPDVMGPLFIFIFIIGVLNSLHTHRFDRYMPSHVCRL
ncbi:hypothetical protein [Aestuariirhabdus litorea]|uniref:hypothetical protein n=1 Tax=Aestuariirhabdus litorea TaxID=2528527 RepID=UPI000F620AF0|nr:hypothetical protein [Aestuariirhabdus litorea]RWW97717.1 hypothetical protein DZC74_05130 [Endozoicomonadaceae bacterium GTF-13]